MKIKRIVTHIAPTTKHNNEHRILNNNKEKIEHDNSKIKGIIKDKLKENGVDGTCHVESIENDALDVLVQLHTKEDCKDEERTKNNMVEDITKEEFKNELKKEMMQTNEVVSHALGSLLCSNDNALEREEQMGNTEDKMKED